MVKIRYTSYRVYLVNCGLEENKRLIGLLSDQRSETNRPGLSMLHIDSLLALIIR